MQNRAVRRVIIVGGGTAGWMAAAVMSHNFTPQQLSVTVIESADIGTVGVGEATIPPILALNRQLGIDEDDLMRRTHGTFKLGIEFVDWGKLGDRYFHPFGKYGADIGGRPFHQLWLKTREGALKDYSISTLAAMASKFTRPSEDPRNVLSQLSYALHFDASLYAKVLAEIAIGHGVRHVEGRIVAVQTHSETGFVEALKLADGQTLAADLFIDCSGFKGLLIEETLRTGYEDWSHWLPVDRAIALPSQSAGPLLPYTRATAGAAGWQWRIPLQHRTGNGHVYCSHFIDDTEAEAHLRRGLGGTAIAEPRHLKFTTGRRKLAWNKNVVALGLASGFIEPLESTSIHLALRGVTALMALFPSNGFEAVEVDEYNRQMLTDFEEIRDFIILHYKQTQRTDSEFWRYVGNMSVPESLARRMQLFALNGRLFIGPDELFKETSWISVMMGQGIEPMGYDKLADLLDGNEIRMSMKRMKEVLRRGADSMPTHQQYIASLPGQEAS